MSPKFSTVSAKVVTAQCIGVRDVLYRNCKGIGNLPDQARMGPDGLVSGVYHSLVGRVSLDEETNMTS